MPEINQPTERCDQNFFIKPSIYILLFKGNPPFSSSENHMHWKRTTSTSSLITWLSVSAVERAFKPRMPRKFFLDKWTQSSGFFFSQFFEKPAISLEKHVWTESCQALRIFLQRKYFMAEKSELFRHTTQFLKIKFFEFYSFSSQSTTFSHLLLYPLNLQVLFLPNPGEEINLSKIFIFMKHLVFLKNYIKTYEILQKRTLTPLRSHDSIMTNKGLNQSHMRMKHAD